MDALKQAIKERGEMINEDVLKVDAFINHQVDPVLMKEIAQDIYSHFQHKPITKIVTIETSGIAPALYCAEYFKVPLVFLKKSKPNTMNEGLYCASVHSFTKNTDYIMTGSSAYLKEQDHVILVDDFLANGEAMMGAIQIMHQAHAQIEGIAILIEKMHQRGHQRLTDAGFDVYALARIKSMENGTISFADDSDT